MRLSQCKNMEEVARLKASGPLCCVEKGEIRFVEPARLNIVPYGTSFKALEGDRVLPDLMGAGFLYSKPVLLKVYCGLLKVRYRHLSLEYEEGVWRFSRQGEGKVWWFFRPREDAEEGFGFVLKNGWSWQADLMPCKGGVRVIGYAELESEIPMLAGKMTGLVRSWIEKEREGLEEKSRALDELEKRKHEIHN